MKHKWLYAATIATAVIVAPVAADASFTDVKKGTEQEKAIQSLVDRGAISGYTDGTFKPGNPVTRAQAAKILAGALKLDTTNVKDPGFKDVSKSNSYYKYIAAIANAGYMSGSNGSFNPSKNVTRGQLSKVLALAYDLNAKNYIHMPFSDAQGSSFLPHIKSLLMYEITTGISADTFGVNKPVSRGQLAVFIHRTEQYKALPAYNETVTGKTVSLDRVQFEVGKLRTEGEQLYNDGIIEITSSEYGDHLTFTPLKEGTAYVNVIGQTPDVDDVLANQGYEFEVKRVNGALQVTMTALPEPLPLLTTVTTGDYTSVKVFDLNNKQIDALTDISPSESAEGNDVSIAVKNGGYKLQLTTSAGKTVETYAGVYDYSSYTLGYTGQLFTKTPIELDIAANVKDLFVSLYSEKMTAEVIGQKLVIKNPETFAFSVEATVNGEFKYLRTHIGETKDGFIVPDDLINLLQAK